MTAIAIKDGIIAADSRIVSDDLLMGIALKVFPVDEAHGGGFVGWTGKMALGARAARTFSELGTFKSGEDFWLIHLTAKGEVFYSEDGAWGHWDAPFYAFGAARPMLMGALAAGASAEEAVRIACEYDTTCGLPILVHSINGKAQ